MLLQRLCELRKKIEYSTPESYKIKQVHFVIEIGLDGRFLGLSPLGESEGKRQACLEMPVPDRIRGGKSPEPLLFTDKPQYLLGISDPKEPGKALSPEDAHQLFLQLFQEVFDACASDDEATPFLEATQGFLFGEGRVQAAQELAQRYEDRDQRAKKEQIYDKAQQPQKNNLFTLRVEDVFLHNLPCVQEFWADLCRKGSAGKNKKTNTKKQDDGEHGVLRCLVTGKEAEIARLHDEVKVGPQNCQLVSANNQAFLSYGHKQSYTSPVSQDAMKAYTEAMRYLLEEKQHHASVGGTYYLFWSKNDLSGLPLDIFDDAQPEQVTALFQTVFSGRQGDLDLVEPYDFFAVSLRYNQKRMIIRDYLETTLASLKNHLAQWFQGHAIFVSPTDEQADQVRYFGIYHLASAFTRNASREFKEMEKLSPAILDALFHAAMKGTPLPLSLLAHLMTRLRNDGRLVHSPQRAALLRAILNANQATESPMSEKLDLQQHHPAYLCGRLFAVLEDLQRAALGKVNATIADRFMGTASSAPASVFGRLLRGAQPHLQSLRKKNEPAYIAIQQRIEEILQYLQAFPHVLPLKEQGVFALGYYHQRHATRAEIRARKELKELASLLDDDRNVDASEENAA